MSKQPDFGSDLANLNENVSAEVGTVLQVLQQQRTANRPTIVRNQPESATAIAEPASADATSEKTTTPPAQRRQRSTNRSRLEPTMERDEPKENVTVKLRLRTNELLTEVALRQQLKKEVPMFRQDIVEAALGEWFRKYGYLP